MRDLLENKVFRICLISVVVIIIIMLLIALFVGRGKKTITEFSLIEASKRYYEKNSNLLPKQKYETSTVNLSTLIENGYVNSKVTSECPVYVTVTNLGNTYDYNAVTECFKNGTLLNKLLTNKTSSGSGLYDLNGGYIFRGENPNNYVKLGNFKWRVIGIDSNSNIKLIYSDILYATLFNEWDDRYNEDVDSQRGKNEYLTSEKSRLKEYLDNFLSMEINGEYFSGKLISILTRHNVCIGKLNINNNSNICSKVLDNQLVSTITTNDYINASLDPLCSLSNSINCQNYNFLNSYGWTINANAENTYTAYYIDEYEGLKTQFASLRSPVRPVITIKNTVNYLSGTGTEEDPYIVR